MSELIVKAFNILILALIAFAFYKKCPQTYKKFFWPGLLLKIFCGIIYGLLYLHYYDYGDTFSYFKQGVKVAGIADTDIGEYVRFIFFNESEEKYGFAFNSIYHSRSFWMIKAISPLLVMTADNYWLTSCYLSLFAFLGIFYLFIALNQTYPEYKKQLLISFFLFPSFVFWSSGLTKESLAIGSLFFLIGFVMKLSHKVRITAIECIILPVAVYVEWKVRVFYLAVFILTFGIYLIFHLLSKNKKLFAYRWPFIILISFSAVAVISLMDYSLHFSNVLDSFTHAYQTNYSKNPSNAIKYFQLDSSLSSLMLNSPYALISGLFRPFVFEAQSWPMILVGIENFILLTLCVAKIPTFKKNMSGKDWPLWGFVLMLALFLALATPNFGTLTRYKVAFLPLLLFLLLKENPILMRYRIFKEGN